MTFYDFEIETFAPDNYQSVLQRRRIFAKTPGLAFRALQGEAYAFGLKRITQLVVKETEQATVKSGDYGHLEDWNADE